MKGIICRNNISVTIYVSGKGHVIHFRKGKIYQILNFDYNYAHIRYENLRLKIHRWFFIKWFYNYYPHKRKSNYV